MVAIDHYITIIGITMNHESLLDTLLRFDTWYLSKINQPSTNLHGEPVMVRKTTRTRFSEPNTYDVIFLNKLDKVGLLPSVVTKGQLMNRVRIRRYDKIVDFVN